MTTTPGNGPLPSGSARNALISSSPDLSVTSEDFTSAAASPAVSGSSSTASQAPRVLCIVGSSSKRGTGNVRSSYPPPRRCSGQALVTQGLELGADLLRLAA